MFQGNSIWYFVALLMTQFLLPSCQRETGGKLLAVLGEEKLYYEDLPLDRMDQLSAEDSVQFVQNYVTSWLESRLMYSESRKIMDDQDPQLILKLNEYKENLMLYELEKTWLKGFTDTVISESELLSYYQERGDDFLLRSNIVKMRYLKLVKPVIQRELQKVKGWLFEVGIQNDSMLRTYAEKEADNFYLDDQWLNFDEVLREIPISPNFNQERYLEQNKKVTLEDERYVYLIYFYEFKTKNEVSPFELERESIRKYLLLHRQTQWIAKKRKDLIQLGLKRKDLQLHTSIGKVD